MKDIFLKRLSNKLDCPFLFLVVAVTGWAGAVDAKEIYIQPSISLKAEYDDNKRMETGRFTGFDTSSYGVITRAKAKTGVRSSQYDLEVENQVVINRYESDFDLDSEDYFLDFSAGYNFSEKSRLGLSADYTLDTTLSSELQGEGTGVVEQDNIRRQQWSITPNWVYSLSNTQYIQSSYTHSETDYAESEVGSFVDYTIDNISLSFNQQWTEALSNNLSISAMSFDIPEINTRQINPLTGKELINSRETTEYTINIGAEYQIAPTWSTSLSVGQRFTSAEETRNEFKLDTRRFEKVNTSSDAQGLIFSFALNKQFETGSADISYSRSTNAQGDGVLVVNDSFIANYQHRLSQVLLFSVKGELLERSTSGSEDDNNGRTYFSIRPVVKWWFDSQVSLTASYQYRTQNFERDNSEGISNSISLNFNYQWGKTATQRY